MSVNECNLPSTLKEGIGSESFPIEYSSEAPQMVTPFLPDGYKEEDFNEGFISTRANIINDDSDHRYRLSRHATRLIQVGLLLVIAMHTLSGIQAMGIPTVQLDLEIDDPCWYYTSYNPIFVCTVHSMDFPFLWRKDWSLIGEDGIIVIDEPSLYHLSTQTIQSSVMRKEALQLSSNITKSVLKDGGTFLCENQGFQSRHVSLSIPDCQTCGACVKSTEFSTAEMETSSYGVTMDGANLTSGSTGNVNGKAPIAHIAIGIAFGCCCVAMPIPLIMYWRQSKRKLTVSENQEKTNKSGNKSGSSPEEKDSDSSCQLPLMDKGS